MDTSTKYLTVTDVARVLRVKREKVLGWIRNGSLPAINVAAHQRARPLYRIDPADAERFRAERATAPPAKRASRRHKRLRGVREYF